MKTTKQAKFEQLMAKGKWHYIFFHGVLGWGVTTAVLFSLAQYYFNEVSFVDSLKLSMVIFPIGGVFWGAFMWWFFKKFQSKNQS